MTDPGIRAGIDNGVTRPRILAVSCAVVAVVVYAGMWLGYRQHWSCLHSVDWSLLNAAHSIGVKHPGWVRFWDAVSFVMGPVPLRIVGMVGAVVSAVNRNVRAALLLLTCLTLTTFVTSTAKDLADRPRPVTALVAVPQTSFPSGHALEAMAGVLALLTVVLPLLRGSWRWIAVAVGAVWVLTVGSARVALNVHHPSDVLAGWALGYLYFLLCLWLIRRSVRSRRGDRTGSEHLLDPAIEPIRR
jgi:membrane-associated phospholipid phosphatase